MITNTCKYRVLVLTLFSSEHEFSQSIESLSRQTYPHWEQKVFSYLPNRMAHDCVYSEIMNRSNEFDLFVKYDADMVFKHDQALELIVKFFHHRPGVDQANFAVHDVLSNSLIMGLLVFSHRAIWPISQETLFVDHTPVIPGRRLLVWDNPAPLVWHSPNPGLFQAFHFGAHRALKAIQRDRPNKAWIQSAIQWRLLHLIWKRFEVLQDRTSGLVMLGAFCVWTGKVGSTGNEYADEGTKRIFENYADIDTSELYKILRSQWKPIVQRHTLLYMCLWPQIAGYKLATRIRTQFSYI